MTPYTFSLLCFGFCSIFVGLLIALKRLDRVGYLYFFFSLLIGCWSIIYSQLIVPNNTYESALRAVRLADLFSLFIPSVWFHFCLTYTRDKSKKWLLLMLFYAISAFLTFFAFSPLFIADLKSVAGFRYWAVTGPIFHLLTVFFFTAIPLGSLTILRFALSLNGSNQRREIAFFIATTLGFVGGGFTFFPVYDIALSQKALFLMPAYPFVTAYFLIRDQLFNPGDIAIAARKEKLAAIGTLATSISHEIHNPLYVIKSLGESHLANIDEGLIPDKDKQLALSREIHNKSIEQAERAMRIIKHFSTFAKQEVSDRPTLKRVSLAEIISSIRPLVAHELELENINLVINLDHSLPELKVDRHQLEEVFFNLIVNACQAIKRSGKSGTITVSGKANTENVTITVSDDGPGMDKQQVKRIFDPFYTTREEGTGLGLYITKQLVEKSGGSIRVRSTQSSGTQFTLTFRASRS